MPISSLRALAVAAFLSLGACVTAGLGAPQGIAVVKGTVTIAGPRGYCVDRRLSRDGADEAFVVLGACSALAPGGAVASGTPVVMTVTVSTAPAAARSTPADLERFVRSDAGRAALSRSGQAATVEILSARQDGQALFLQIRDQSAGEATPKTDSTYWRAIFGMGDTVITASILAFSDRPVGRAEGFRRLAEFVARLQAVNAEIAAPT
jgi:hypothetical protein